MKEKTSLGYFDLSSNYEISTYPEKDKYPIMHINIGDDDIPDSCIFLTKNSYYGKESLLADFSEEGLKEIDDFLREKRNDGLTNWEYLCKDWNEYTPYNKIEFPKEQPNYIKTKNVIEREE